MLLRRVLCTTVVLAALALLHWPQFAHAVIIVKDNSSLTAIDASIATYNASTGELHIKSNITFNLTLAASEPVFSMDVKLVDARSEIQIVSAAFLQDVDNANCTWTIATYKPKTACTMTFTVYRTEAEDEVASTTVTYSSSKRNCGDKDFVLLQVDVPPNPANISVTGMHLSSRNQEVANEEVLECKEIRPKPYHNRSIQSSTPLQSSSDVTYVWEIAVTKTTAEDFFIRLPPSMTPVRFDPDPTTTAPTTTDTFANSTNTTTTTTAKPPGDDTALSALEIGVIVGGVVIVLIIVIAAIVIVVICTRRRPTGQTNTVEEEPPPEVPAALDDRRHDPEDDKPHPLDARMRRMNEIIEERNNQDKPRKVYREVLVDPILEPELYARICKRQDARRNHHAIREGMDVPAKPKKKVAEPKVARAERKPEVQVANITNTSDTSASQDDGFNQRDVDAIMQAEKSTSAAKNAKV